MFNEKYKQESNDVSGFFRYSLRLDTNPVDIYGVWVSCSSGWTRTRRRGGFRTTQRTRVCFCPTGRLNFPARGDDATGAILIVYF